MTCYVSSNISAGCNAGHEHDGPVHVVGEITKQGSVTVKSDVKFYCAAHCPKCSVQHSLDWKEPAKTIAGEQEGLF